MHLKTITDSLMSNILVCSFMEKVAHKNKQYGVASRWQASKGAYEHSLNIICSIHANEHFYSDRQSELSQAS